jgi:hypothetical protein
MDRVTVVRLDLRGLFVLHEQAGAALIPSEMS